ncbi:MAG: SDR family NAD(P)-dependent oxidoreductase [Microthrixaceae bacterium]
MDEFDGRVAVITGGAGGVGAALGERCAAEGMKVVLADVEADALDAVVLRLRTAGADAEAVVCDVTDFDSVVGLADFAYDRFGAVHLLCNNVGVGASGRGNMWDHTLNDWGWGISVNVWGVVHGIKAFVPRMIEAGEEGHVMNTSSGNGGIAPLPNTAVYATTKAAVTTLSEVLYGQLLAVGADIGVSVLFPGPKVLNTGLLTSGQRRPRRWSDGDAPSGPRSAAEIEARLRAAGVEPDFTPVEDVAAEAIEGVRAGRFWILPRSDRTDSQIRARADSMLSRSNPTYMHPPRRP